MKVNRRLNKFIRKNMYVMELRGKRVLLIKHIPFWRIFKAVAISNEHARRYIR